MTDVLLPISSSGPATGARDALLGGLRSVLSVRPQSVESSAALRPVDPSALAKDTRMDTARDLPVGPAPSFKINALQQLRASLHDQAEGVVMAHDDAALHAEASVEPAVEIPAAEVIAYQSGYVSDTASEGQDHVLNIKV